jgi:hypothetical protein
MKTNLMKRLEDLERRTNAKDEFTVLRIRQVKKITPKGILFDREEITNLKTGETTVNNTEIFEPATG